MPPLPAFPLFLWLTGLTGRVLGFTEPHSPPGDQLEGQAAEHDGAAAGTPDRLRRRRHGFEHGLGFDVVVVVVAGLSLHVVLVRYFALHLKEGQLYNLRCLVIRKVLSTKIWEVPPACLGSR